MALKYSYNNKVKCNFMNQRLVKILELMPPDTYITSEYLAKQLNVSTKTMRSRIKEIDNVISHYGAYIESKPRYGYRIIIENKERYAPFIKSVYTEAPAEIPIGPDARVQYLLVYLLNNTDYIKIDELSELLCISRTSIIADIKHVEQILNQYNIQLLRKPKHGLKTVGDESRIRICLVDYTMRRNSSVPSIWKKKEEELKPLGNIILDVANRHDLYFSGVALQTLIEHCSVITHRLKKSFAVENMECNGKGDNTASTYHVAREILEKIKEQFQIEYTQNEIYYLGILLASQRDLGLDGEAAGNIVITEEIQRLTEKMLLNIKEALKVDLRKDLELRISLSQYLIPFDIRTKYDIGFPNSMVEEIKQDYAFAFNIATIATIPLKEYYGKTISDDEIGYFAIIFALALEQKNKSIDKKNILLVCSTGLGSSKLLAYKCRREFGNYINDIKVCDISHLNQLDLSEIDCVFTTVPIVPYIPVPVFEVRHFLNSNETDHIQRLMKKHEYKFPMKYYKKELFFENVSANDRNSVMEEIYQRIQKIQELPEGFKEAVEERESLSSTDYGNNVAIPHPIRPLTEETFVVVAVLEKPIIWERQEVQVIFLISLAKGEIELQNFYEYTMSIITSQENIQALVENPKFETLMTLLQKG